MYSIIFSIALLVIAGLFVLCGVLKGKKYVWIYSAIRLGAAVISLVVALFLSRGIAQAISGAVMDLLVKMDAMSELSGFVKDLPTIKEAICALLSMILAPGLFVTLFFVCKTLLGIAVRIISRKIAKSIHEKNSVTIVEVSEKKKKKKAKKSHVLLTRGPNPIGMACGAVCSLLIFFVIFVPVVGTFGLVDSVMSMVSSDMPVVQTVSQITDAAANNVGSQSIRVLGGGAIYNKLTTYEVGGHDVSLAKEMDLVTAVGNAVATVKDPSVSRADAGSAVRSISPVFSETSLIPAVGADFLSAANASWERGEKFNGIAKPSIGGEMAALIDPLWSLLSTSTYDTMKTDVATILEVAAIMVEEDAFSAVKRDPLSLFEHEDISASILFAFLSNDHTSPVVGSIAEYGIQMLASQLKVDLDGIHLDSSAITDKTAESHALANAFGESLVLIRKAQGGGFEITNSIESMGPVLDALSATQTVGRDNSALILSGILGSESVYSKVGFTKDEATSIANSINEKSKVQGYTPLMRSLAHTIDVVQLAGKKDSDSKTEMNQKVETLIQDMTPESAEVLQQISTPGVMQNYGVPERSAEPTAGMVSNLFGNLSAAKESGMSEEEYSREAQATTDLLNLAVSRNDGENGKVFGEGSATGKTATEYVNTVFDSVVVSQTIVETAYPTGEETDPVNDPLNAGQSLSEEETVEIVDALNARWNAATEEEKASEEYKKTYFAIGSLMNVPLEFTESGIVVVQQ